MGRPTSDCDAPMRGFLFGLLGGAVVLLAGALLFSHGWHLPPPPMFRGHYLPHVSPPATPRP